jgi:hypothetical protein
MEQVRLLLLALPALPGPARPRIVRVKSASQDSPGGQRITLPPRHRTPSGSLPPTEGSGLMRASHMTPHMTDRPAKGYYF